MFFKGGRGFLAGEAGGPAKKLAAGCVAEGDVDLSAGQVLLGNGTNGAPSLSFADETNTGWYKPSAFNVAQVIGAASRFTVGGTITSSVAHSMQGDLAVQQAFRLYAETVKTTDYTIAASDSAVVMDDGGGVALTITLPVAPATRQRVAIRNQGASALTIARNGHNINGAAANLSLAAGAETVLIYVDTNQWYEVG